jgi:uncharacterized protein YqeY
MDPLLLLQTDMKNAMKAGEKQRLDAIRYLIAQVKNFQIDKGLNAEVTEADLHQVVKKLVKNTEEAVSQYRNAGRDDLASEDEARMQVWQTYLPQQLSDEELRSIVDRVLEANPGMGIGPLTGMVLREAAGKADGGRVSALLREKLG